MMKHGGTVRLETERLILRRFTEEDAEAVESATSAAGNRSEAINALLVLGYSRPEAMQAMKGIGDDVDLETMIRMALKKLMKQ